MEEGTTLSGACSCGRNHYVIFAPPQPIKTLSILYDDRAENRRALSLRVPLANLQTTTYAFFPDETHNAIRRVFTPQLEPQTKRHFCGFCGTHLTHWSEDPPEEAEWVCVNLGSLKSDSMDKLEDSGILSGLGEEAEGSIAVAGREARTSITGTQGREVRGNPWFEEVIEGSELGRLRRRRGGEKSADGKTQVEWEVVEFEADDTEPGGGTGPGKRKLGSLGDQDDLVMRGN